MSRSGMAAEPYEFDFDPKTTALIIIDMQRDFVEPGGFGEALGNDVSVLRACIPPIKRVLDAPRQRHMTRRAVPRFPASATATRT